MTAILRFKLQFEEKYTIKGHHRKNRYFENNRAGGHTFVTFVKGC